MQRFAGLVWPGIRLMIDPHRLIWQYVENPYRRKSECSTLYVFVDDCEVLGTLGTIPVELCVGKRRVYAHWLTDWYVLPSSKGTGIGGSLLRHCMMEYPLVMGVGTGPESYRLFMKAGFDEVNGYCNFWHYSLPSLGQIFTKPKEVFRTVLHFADIIDSLYVTHEPIAKLYFRKLEKFTQEMADLTEDILPKSGRSIYVKRTVAYMNWKFSSFDGIREYELFEIVDSDNSVGWMMLSCNYSKLRGVIVELCLKNMNRKQYYEESLHYATQYFKQKGMNFILSFDDKGFEKEYNNSGYKNLGSRTKIIYYTTNRHLKSEIKMCENHAEQPWFVSYGDSDLVLYA